MAATAGVLAVLLLVITVFTIDIQRLARPDKPQFGDSVKTKPAATKAKDAPARK